VLRQKTAIQTRQSQRWETATNETWLSTRCYDNGDWQTVT